MSAHKGHNRKKLHRDLPEPPALRVAVIHRDGGNPLPERTVFKQGALAPRHRAATTAAAAVVITLGVACEALASSRHDEAGWGTFP